MKVRDYIDINPVHRHPGWRFGQIRRVDKYSGQVQVVYKEGGSEYLYWVHLNNPEEAAPFMSKAEETLRRKAPPERKSKGKAKGKSSAAAPPPEAGGGGGGASGASRKERGRDRRDRKEHRGGDRDRDRGVGAGAGAGAGVDDGMAPPPRERDLPPKPPRKSRGGSRYTATAGPPKKSLPPAPATSAVRGVRKWTCHVCGGANDIHEDGCIKCGTLRSSKK